MKYKSREDYAIINSSTSLISKIIILLSAFIVRTLFIKLLASEYLGISGLFTNILNVLSLAELGIGTAITYSMYKPIAVNDIEKVRALYKLYSKCYKIIGIIVLILGSALIPFLKYIIKDYETYEINLMFIYLIYLAKNVLSYFIFAYKNSLLIAYQQTYIYNIINSIIYIVRVIVETIVLVLYKNFYLYLFLEIFFDITTNVFVALYVDKKYSFITKSNNDKLSNEDKSKIYKNIYALSIYKIGSIAVNSTDNIIISNFCGLIILGFYSNYNLIITSITSIVSMVFNALIPSIGNLNSLDLSIEHKKDVFDKINFLSFFMYSFCSICLFSLLNPFISIWAGEEYILSQNIVLIIVLNFLTYGLLTPVLLFREGCGLYYFGRYRPLLSAVLNIIFSIILGKYFGLFGILLATLISRLFAIIWYEPLMVYKHVFNKKPYSFYVKYCIEVFFTLIICYAFYLVINKFSYTTYFQLIILFVVVILLSIVLLSAVSLKNRNFKYYANLVKNKIIRRLKNEKI